LYDNKFEYSTFAVIEKSGGSDLDVARWASIEPLKTGTLHYLTTVPTEITTDDNPIDIIIDAGGKFFRVNIK